MNKTELIGAVHTHLTEVQETEATKTLVEKVLNSFFSVVPADLAANKEEEGYKVEVMGFGKWTASFVAGREGVNPKNRDEVVQIPDSFRIHFSAGQNFKDVVNGVAEAPKAKAKKTATKSKAKASTKATATKTTGKKKKKK
jgi:nucleoid DNA-binding protein